MHHPTITIIIATFNAGQHLARCLDSIAAQTWAAREIIIQDGGSTDSTAQIAAGYANLPCSFASEPDRGIYDAWNKALGRATGDWVLFLGADDQLVGPQALACAAKKLAALPPEILYAYTPLPLTLNSGEILDTKCPDIERVWTGLPHGMTIPHSGTFHRRILFKEQAFDPDFRIAGDYEFIARTLRPGNYTLLDEPVATMTLGGASSSLRHMLGRELEFFRVSRRFFPRSFPWRLYLRIVRGGVYVGLEAVLGSRRATMAADAYRVLCGKKPLWRRLQ